MATAEILSNKYEEILKKLLNENDTIVLNSFSPIIKITELNNKFMDEISSILN